MSIMRRQYHREKALGDYCEAQTYSYGDLGQWQAIGAIASIGSTFAKLFGGSAKVKPKRYAAGFAFKQPPTMASILNALNNRIVSVSGERAYTLCNDSDLRDNGNIVIGSGGWKGHSTETAALIGPGTNTARSMATSISQQLATIPEPFRSQILNTPAPISPGTVAVTLTQNTCSLGDFGFTVYAVAQGATSLEQLFNKVGDMFRDVINQVHGTVPTTPATMPAPPVALPGGVMAPAPQPVPVPVSVSPGGTIVPSLNLPSGGSTPPSWFLPTQDGQAAPVVQTGTGSADNTGLLLLAGAGLLLFAVPARRRKSRRVRRIKRR